MRQLHDTTQQHLHALKAMKCEPPGSFITSVIELKLDAVTIFEWQKHSQSQTEVPHYRDLLEFIDLRAQASETSLPMSSKKHVRNEPTSLRKQPSFGKAVASFTVGHAAKSADVTKTNRSAILRHVLIAIILSLLFGLGWAFGLIGTSSLPEEVYIPAQYIFSISWGSKECLSLSSIPFAPPTLGRSGSDGGTRSLYIYIQWTPSYNADTTAIPRRPFFRDQLSQLKLSSTQGRYSSSWRKWLKVVLPSS